MSDDGWTIDELARHATDALASAGVRAPNGRVSAAPDRRVIRWYATIGLLDPPLRTRGRTARYGERHLLQLVAVKRRQAEGHLLAAIQAELTGATDATLRRVASLAAGSGWSATPATATPTAATIPTAATAAPVRAADHPGREPAGERQHFWRAAPAARPATARMQPTAPVYPVPLHPAATLTLAGQPTDGDLAAIHAAARPLLHLLATRGLLTDPPDPPDSPHPPARRPA